MGQLNEELYMLKLSQMDEHELIRETELCTYSANRFLNSGEEALAIAYIARVKAIEKYKQMQELLNV